MVANLDSFVLGGLFGFWNLGLVLVWFLSWVWLFELLIWLVLLFDFSFCRGLIFEFSFLGFWVPDLLFRVLGLTVVFGLVLVAVLGLLSVMFGVGISVYACLMGLISCLLFVVGL